MLLLLNPNAPGPVNPVIPAEQEPDDHVFFGFNNLIDRSQLSGGSWLENLPLANLKNRTLARVARSTSAAPSATWFDIAAPVDQTWRALAFVNHNLSLSARYRVRASTTPTFASTTYNSGWLDVWPAVYSEDELLWEAVNWWEGTYTEDDRQGYIWTLIHRLPVSTTSPYVRVEFDDQLNPQSCVQIGRPFIGDGWTPSHNIEIGATLGWEDESDVQQAYGGAEFFGEQPRFRVGRVRIENIGDDEAYRQAFEMMRRVGITGEVLFMWDPSDTKHAIRRQFVGRFRQLSPIEHPYPLLDSVGFEIKENQR